MDKMTIQDEKFINSLSSLTPRKVTQFIEMISQSKPFDNEHDFVTSVKSWFVINAFEKLDIRVRIFESSYHKFKTQLNRCPTTGKPFVSISKKDFKDINAAYAKLYDLHKDLLLELVEKHDENSLVLEVV